MLRIHAALLALLCGVGALSLLCGPGDLGDAQLSGIYLQLRATRLLCALLAGAALAVGGVLVQGLFRNPLADPSVLGTTAGANLGGRLALLAFQGLLASSAGRWIAPEMAVPVGCLAGALAALALLLAVQRAQDDRIVLLLTGFLLSSLFISLGGFAASLAMESFELARAMASFALGDLSGAGPRHVALAAPLVIAGTLAAWLWSRPLDLLLSGEDEARTLGVAIDDVRLSCILWAAVLTAAAVSLGGAISFVGLIVPHALRPFVGAGHRQLVPASALLGAAFVVACDTLIRVLPTRTEVPLGVVTGLIGAPVFLALLLRSRRELLHG